MLGSAKVDPTIRLTTRTRSGAAVPGPQIWVTSDELSQDLFDSYHNDSSQ